MLLLIWSGIDVRLFRPRRGVGAYRDHKDIRYDGYYGFLTIITKHQRFWGSVAIRRALLRLKILCIALNSSALSCSQSKNIRFDRSQNVVDCQDKSTQNLNNEWRRPIGHTSTPFAVRLTVCGLLCSELEGFFRRAIIDLVGKGKGDSSKGNPRLSR